MAIVQSRRAAISCADQSLWCDIARAAQAALDAWAELDGEEGEEDEHGTDRRQQDDGHDQAEDPTGRREDRHVHVVEHEDLVAQHGEAIEIFGTFVVLDGGAAVGAAVRPRVPQMAGAAA